MPSMFTLSGRILTASLVAIGSFGCSNMNNTQKGAALGAAGGAGVGAIVGKQLGNTGAGALIGGLAGTATGALVGNNKDKTEERDAYARQAAYEHNLRHQEHRAVTNRDVVDMVQNNVTDRTIINTIRDRGGRFDTSPRSIIALHEAGVSDPVIEAMQQHNMYR